jgi:hypothetical protein
MGRSSDSVTRVDIRFSNQMYDEIQQIAIKDGAKTHHISQKVEVSPTIVKLVQFALDTLAGRVPDSIDDISDSVPDTLLSSLPDKQTVVSDIIAEVSDRVRKAVDESFNKEWVELKNTLWLERERVSILVRELASKGIIDSAGSSSPTQPQLLPDKIDNVPDTVPDKDDIISDRVDSLPDSLSDTKNIPSDDSSNFESLAEMVQNIPVDAIEQISGDVASSFSFAGFHDWLKLAQPDKRNKANGVLAIATAKEKGFGDWKMDSSSYRFTKITKD